MTWTEWVLAGSVAFVVVGVLAWRALKASRRGRRFIALPTRSKLRFGRVLLADPGLGWLPKVVLVVLAGYLALPFDIIPDFIPVVGQLDDVAVVLIAVGVLVLSVPRERFEAALDEAEADALARARPVF